MKVESFRIDNKAEADDYLTALFENLEYRSMAEIKARAEKYIRDREIKEYFMKKAREMLKKFNQTD